MFILIESIFINRLKLIFELVLREVKGQTLTILSNIVQSSIIALKVNPERIKSNLLEANRIVKQGLIELRWSITALINDKVEPEKFIATLQRMFKNTMVWG